MINNECIEGEEGSLLLVPGSDTTHLRISKSPFGFLPLHASHIFCIVKSWLYCRIKDKLCFGILLKSV